MKYMHRYIHIFKYRHKVTYTGLFANHDAYQYVIVFQSKGLERLQIPHRQIGRVCSDTDSSV